MDTPTSTFIDKQLVAKNENSFLRNPVEQAVIFYTSILKIVTEIEVTG